MKRYRIFPVDFDTRALLLAQVVGDAWTEDAKALHRANVENIDRSLLQEFGPVDAAIKRENFIAFGPKQISVVAFHNRFFEQIRTAFIMGAYYPALTGACALGERILNHLILKLRDNYKATPEYKDVYRKDSFDDWIVPIRVLESWKVLLPDAVKGFRSLRESRNKAIHFNPDVDTNDRELALTAVKYLQDIIKNQFSGLGQQPWFFVVPGEGYIKKEWEQDPFVKLVYLPNCLRLSPFHRVVSVMPWKVTDEPDISEAEVSDEEYSSMRQDYQKGLATRPASGT